MAYENYKRQIKNFKKGKEIETNVDEFKKAYKSRERTTREGKSAAFKKKMDMVAKMKWGDKKD